MSELTELALNTIFVSIENIYLDSEIWQEVVFKQIAEINEICQFTAERRVVFFFWVFQFFLTFKSTE